MSTIEAAVQPQIIEVHTTSKPTSGLAIAGFVLSIVGVSVLGLILSAVAMPQTKQTHSGRGFAIAGIVLGILGTIVWVMLFAGIFAAGSALSGYAACIDQATTAAQELAC